jgi:8-hydroxy-5-deazaflavin:NADPH oxidoreductase
MKSAIIGLASIGSRVASNLTAGGEAVIVSERNRAKAEQLAKKLGTSAVAIEDALRAADVIVLRIQFDSPKDFVAAHRSALTGKIVVDPSNPIAPDGKGGFTVGSRAQGAELIKAFGTLSAESLGSARNRSLERAVLFYATDYPEAGKAVAKLITGSGFAPINVGHPHGGRRRSPRVWRARKACHGQGGAGTHLIHERRARSA